jgi:hypothetical protein
LAPSRTTSPLSRHAQELGLHLVGHVADLVEEQRAAVGVLEAAGPIGAGVGERAADVAEELVLQDRRGEAGAVERDQPGLAALGVVVDRAGDELLAGAVLPEDQHGDIAGRHLPGGADHRLHRGALADHALEPAGEVDLLLEHLVLPLQRRPLGGAVDLGAEVLEVERLLDEAVRALVHRLDGRRDVAVRRDEDDRRRRRLPLGAASTSSPSLRPSIIRSVTTTSYRRRSSFDRASARLYVTSHLWPWRDSASHITCAWSSSSSMTSTAALGESVGISRRAM